MKCSPYRLIQILVQMDKILMSLGTLSHKSQHGELERQFFSEAKTMKLLLVFIGSVISVSAAKGLNFTDQDENYGITWMYFPGGDGVPYKIELEKPRKKIWIESKEKVYFHLYTRYYTFKYLN